MTINNVKLKRNLVTYTNPDSFISEQFKTIRTNIKFSALEKKTKIIQITSPIGREGKTTTAANLAVSMAQHKESVLLIDANLRNPAVHNVFKISNHVGLTTILLESPKSLKDIVLNTGIGRLDVLTSGPAPVNPAELIGSSTMQELLNTVALSYDWIIIDSPSILEVTDAKILANYCDSIILVFDSRRTKMKHGLATKKALEFAEKKIVGVILNDNVRNKKIKLF